MMHAARIAGYSAAIRRQLQLVAATALIGLGASAARADVLNVSTNVNAQVFNNVLAPVDLATSAGVQSTLPFTTSAPDLVQITFSAECSVASTPLQSGSIQIEVDPAGPAGWTPVPPTVGSDDAFCSGNTVAGVDDGWVTPSMTVVARVPDGTHRVRVLAQSVGVGAVLRLDDLSITVIN